MPTIHGADTTSGARQQDEKEIESKMARGFNPAQIPLQFQHDGPAIVLPTREAEGEVKSPSRLDQAASKKKTSNDFNNRFNKLRWTSYTTENDCTMANTSRYWGDCSTALPESPILCHKCSEPLQEAPHTNLLADSGICAPPTSPMLSPILIHSEMSPSNVLVAAMAPEEKDELKVNVFNNAHSR